MRYEMWNHSKATSLPFWTVQLLRKVLRWEDFLPWHLGLCSPVSHFLVRIWTGSRSPWIQNSSPGSLRNRSFPSESILWWSGSESTWWFLWVLNSFLLKILELISISCTQLLLVLNLRPNKFLKMGIWDSFPSLAGLKAEMSFHWKKLQSSQ